MKIKFKYPTRVWDDASKILLSMRLVIVLTMMFAIQVNAKNMTPVKYAYKMDVSLGEMSAPIQNLRGTVTDEKGEVLVGASVIVKGTKKGTVTNAAGEFTINAEPDDVLIISFLGFQRREVKIGAQTNFEIRLTAVSTEVEEMVVIGYGTQRKRDVAGAIASLSSKDLSIQSASNVQNLFQGRLSGVSVTTSGVPGDAPTVRIRGIGTIGNSSLLYVIDGFPTKGDIASLINPSNIESVQVLKDASSASIYGAQAANGVILITTKQGKIGKPEFSVKVNTGLQLPSNLPKMLNTKQYGEVLWNAMKNAGLSPSHAQYGSGNEPVIPDIFYRQESPEKLI